MNKSEFAAKLSSIEDLEAFKAEIASVEEDDAIMEVLRSHNVNLTEEDILSLSDDDEELSEDALDDVVGGCKCKGFLKRTINNILFWFFEKATGVKTKCLDCGH